MKKGFTLVELMVVIGVIGLLAAVVLPRFSDSADAARAAQVHGNLHNIQEAVDMFNAFEGYYPVLGEDIGAGSGGNEFSERFEKYYSKGRMPETPAGGKNISGNQADRERVYEWSENELLGGWLYNEERGKLYARLEEDAYGQGNIWISQGELNEGGAGSKVYEGMTLKREEVRWFSPDEFGEFVMETTFTIGSAGRMEIYLEGEGVDGNPEGYRIRIHPVMEKLLIMNGSKNPDNVVTEVDLGAAGINKSTWFKDGTANEVPIKMSVSNGDSGNKEMSLEINGEQISFESGESIVYKPANEVSQIGLGNRENTDRKMVVGDITVTGK